MVRGPGLLRSRSVEEVSDPKASKKGRHVSKKRKHSYVAGPAHVNKNFEDFCSSPVDVAFSVFKHLRDIDESRRLEADKKVKAAEAESLKAKKEKEEMEELLQKGAGELRTVLVQLEKAQNLLSETARRAEKAEADLDVAEKKVTGLEDRVQTLEAEKTEGQQTIESLRARVANLEGELNSARENLEADTKERITRLEADLAEAKKDAFQRTTDALDMGVEGFTKALLHVDLVHPEIKLRREFLDFDNEIEDGQIVSIDLETGEKTVVFPSAEV